MLISAGLPSSMVVIKYRSRFGQVHIQLFKKTNNNIEQIINSLIIPSVCLDASGGENENPLFSGFHVSRRIFY